MHPNTLSPHRAVAASSAPKLQRLPPHRASANGRAGPGWPACPWPCPCSHPRSPLGFLRAPPPAPGRCSVCVPSPRRPHAGSSSPGAQLQGPLQETEGISGPTPRLDPCSPRTPVPFDPCDTHGTCVLSSGRMPVTLHWALCPPAPRTAQDQRPVSPLGPSR